MSGSPDRPSTNLKPQTPRSSASQSTSAVFDPFGSPEKPMREMDPDWTTKIICCKSKEVNKHQISIGVLPENTVFYRACDDMQQVFKGPIAWFSNYDTCEKPENKYGEHILKFSFSKKLQLINMEDEKTIESIKGIFEALNMDISNLIESFQTLPSINGDPYILRKSELERDVNLASQMKSIFGKIGIDGWYHLYMRSWNNNTKYMDPEIMLFNNTLAGKWEYVPNTQERTKIVAQNSSNNKIKRKSSISRINIPDTPRSPDAKKPTRQLFSN